MIHPSFKGYIKTFLDRRYLNVENQWTFDTPTKNMMPKNHGRWLYPTQWIQSLSIKDTRIAHELFYIILVTFYIQICYRNLIVFYFIYRSQSISIGVNFHRLYFWM